jgi:TonB family protein
MATAVETIPGAPTAIDPLATAAGKGDGPGGGGGRGPGNGRGDGSGLGEGRLAGFGGDVYLPVNGVSNPVLIREVKPKYTGDAMRAKVQGTVEMEAVVRADGTIDPRSIRIVRSLDSTFGLDREAIEAVKQWRFSPAVRKGQPVAALVTVELAFTLR